MLSRTLLPVLAAGALLAPPTTATAEVVVAGTGEPAFTSSANNTQWVEWSTTTPYRVEFRHRVDAGAVVVDGPYVVPSTGSLKVDWTGVAGASVPLQEGRRYEICGFGRWQDGTGMWYPDFSTSCGTAGSRGVATTIDRTKPTATLDAPAATRDLRVTYVAGYADALAPPFGVLFLAVGEDTTFTQQGAACAPADPAATRTTFTCTTTLPDADGPHRLCAMVPDSAIPDNPYSADQRQPATSANRSDPACAEVVLDRAAPTVTLTGPTRVTAGVPATFGAHATDAGSGLDPATGSWVWSDRTAPAGGLQTTRTFRTVGDHEVRFTIRDAAGNTREATRSVTVVAPPTTGPTPGVPTPAPAPAPGVPGPAPAPAPAPVPGAPAGDRAPTGTGAPAARLRVRALGTRRLGRRTLLRLRVTGVSGSVRVALRRGTRTVVARRITVRRGVAALPLPRGMRRGRHTVTVTAGARRATTTATVGTARARAAGPVRDVVDPRGVTVRLP